MGLIDRTEVLKKNPEIFDKAGVLQRMSEIAQLTQQVQGAQEQIKKLKGDLQTAERESVSNRKQVEVGKFKSRLHDILSDAKADNKVKASKIANMVQLESERLRNSTKEAETEMKNQADSMGIPVPLEEFGTS
jgi:exonuclease VII large subunit